jgi:hypothetical protein
MKAFVAVTDRDWYEFLRRRPDLDEVNFWQPGGGRQFRALDPGQPFLFKLHYPERYCWRWVLRAFLTVSGQPSLGCVWRKEWCVIICGNAAAYRTLSPGPLGPA